MGSFKAAVIVLLLGLHYVVHGELCYPGKRFANNIREPTGTCLYEPEGSLSQPINVIVNEHASILKVKFLIDETAVPHPNYTVYLYARKDDDCSNGDSWVGSPPFLHSLRKFSSLKCEDERKGTYDQKFGLVTIKNIYSGCYIAKLDNPYMEYQYSEPKAVITETKYYRLQDIRPSVGMSGETRHYNGTRNLTAHFTHFDVLLKERLPVDVTLVQNQSCDYPDKKNVLAKFSLSVTDEDELQCTQQMNNTPLHSCKKIDETKVSCSFLELAPGNYCLKIDPDDPDNCHKTSIYIDYKGCASIHRFVVDGEIPTTGPKGIKPETPGEGWTIYVAAALLVVSIVAASIVIWKNKRLKEFIYNRVFGPKIQDEVPNNPLPPTAVVLLYAQDNEYFMALMAAFREILSSYGNCKVYDCFDSNCPGLSANPGEWIQHLVNNPDVNVIIVPSPSAVLHQEAIQQQLSVKYHQPLPYSHLFPLALHEVKFNRSKTYKNTFVVRFDDTDIKSLMTFARYCLPQYLNQLLADMDFFRDVENDSVDEKLLLRLKELQDKLKEFYLEYPDYLTHQMFFLKNNL